LLEHQVLGLSMYEGHRVLVTIQSVMVTKPVNGVTVVRFAS